jgi:hypothetical protein
MGKIRRGNYVFVFWAGDHPPRHVHIYRDGRLLLKWDLEHDKPMKGDVSHQILKYINALRREGRL